MVSLRLQKRLAASVLKCGKRRVWLDPTEVGEIGLANSRAGVRRLVRDGFVIRKPVRMHSRARTRAVQAAKAKGRHMGPGTRKGTRNARTPAKRLWITRLRVLRRLLRRARAARKINAHEYRALYLKAKGNIYRNKRVLLEALRKTRDDRKRNPVAIAAAARAKIAADQAAALRARKAEVATLKRAEALHKKKEAELLALVKKGLPLDAEQTKQLAAIKDARRKRRADDLADKKKKKADGAAPDADDEAAEDEAEALQPKRRAVGRLTKKTKRTRKAAAKGRKAATQVTQRSAELKERRREARVAALARKKAKIAESPDPEIAAAIKAKRKAKRAAKKLAAIATKERPEVDEETAAAAEVDDDEMADFEPKAASKKKAKPAKPKEKKKAAPKKEAKPKTDAEAGEAPQPMDEGGDDDGKQ